MDTEFWLDVCKKTGKDVFNEVRKILNKDDKRKVLKRGYSGDITLFIDDLAEKTILKNFKDTGRSFKFISEEVGILDVGDNPEIIVVVDPVDGSNNMRYGVPIACTSIAVGDLSEKMSGIKVGYVKDLILGNEYHAIEGKGAFKNNERINVTKEKKGCIFIDIATDRSRNFKRIIKLGDNFRSVRMIGSSTLQMCYFAEGVSDAHVVLGAVRTTDYAAAQLIVKEAGGITKDLEGKSFDEYKTGFKMKVNLIATSDDTNYKKIRELLSD